MSLLRARVRFPAMWKLIQIATFLAVSFSAVYYGWGDDVSGLAVGAVALFAAFLVTTIPMAIYDLWLRFGPRRMHSKPKRPPFTVSRE